MLITVRSEREIDCFNDPLLLGIDSLKWAKVRERVGRLTSYIQMLWLIFLFNFLLQAGRCRAVVAAMRVGMQVAMPAAGAEQVAMPAAAAEQVAMLAATMTTMTTAAATHHILASRIPTCSTSSWPTRFSPRTTQPNSEHFGQTFLYKWVVFLFLLFYWGMLWGPWWMDVNSACYLFL